MRRIDVAISVAYGTDPEKMLALLVEVAQAHPNVLPLPPPVALFQGFGDVALNFELRAWTNQPDGWVNVRSELAMALYRRLNEESIEIPYPRTDIHVKSLPAPKA
jgi:small-conductance mechanosensitive channel